MSIILNDQVIAGGDKLPGRNIGELVASTIPLIDSGLHLLDGALVNGQGIYKGFVSYIAALYDSGDYSGLFATEANWQAAIASFGVCGKFVYDSTNNTVRLPKITGITEGTTDLTALGSLVQAGLPSMTSNTTGAHTHTRGTMNITANVYNIPLQSKTVPLVRSGAFYDSSTGGAAEAVKSTAMEDAGTNIDNIGFDASKSWSGATSSNGDHSHTVSWGANTNTVQPQTIKVLYYIVIANTIKTPIEVDINEVATDLNGKADTSLTNVPSDCKVLDGQWVSSSVGLASSYTNAPTTTNTTYSLSTYLPNDNYNYEVLVYAIVRSGATAANYLLLDIQTDLGFNCYISGVQTRTSSTIYSCGSCIVPVGTGRQVIVIANDNNNGAYRLYAKGYRRIGTN